MCGSWVASTDVPTHRWYEGHTGDNPWEKQGQTSRTILHSELCDMITSIVVADVQLQEVLDIAFL